LNGRVRVGVCFEPVRPVFVERFVERLRVRLIYTLIVEKVPDRLNLSGTSHVTFAL